MRETFRNLGSENTDDHANLADKIRLVFNSLIVLMCSEGEGLKVTCRSRWLHANRRAEKRSPVPTKWPSSFGISILATSPGHGQRSHYVINCSGTPLKGRLYFPQEQFPLPPELWTHFTNINTSASLVSVKNIRTFLGFPQQYQSVCGRG